jgi:hypothetical protein
MSQQMPIDSAQSMASNLQWFLPDVETQLEEALYYMDGSASPAPAGMIFAETLLGGNTTMTVSNRIGVQVGQFNVLDGLVHRMDSGGGDHIKDYDDIRGNINGSQSSYELDRLFGIYGTGSPAQTPDDPMSTSMHVITWMIGKDLLATPGTGILSDLAVTAEFVTNYTSMLDPTPCSDLINASLKFARGDNLGGALQLAGAAIPFGAPAIAQFGTKYVSAAAKAETKAAIVAAQQTAKHSDDLAKVAIQSADNAVNAAKNVADDVGKMVAGKADDVGKLGDDVVKKADDTLEQCLKNGGCFVGDTPIMTSTSTCKRIDEIRAGDFVLSRSEFDPDGPLELKSVEQVYVLTGRLLKLRIQGRDILTTDGHPFEVKGRGWQKAAELVAGQELWTHDGRLVTIESVDELPRVATVFNFRVAEFHTYYVGSPEWGFDVWVHNVDPEDCARAAGNISGNLPAPGITKIELPGNLNGATIVRNGDNVTMHIIGIDNADDLATIFSRAREAGVTGPVTVYTGRVVSDSNDLARYTRAAATGGTRFGARVEQVGPNQFRLIFEQLPDFI